MKAPDRRCQDENRGEATNTITPEGYWTECKSRAGAFLWRVHMALGGPGRAI